MSDKPKIKYNEEVVPGFRRGMTKEKLLKSLTPEDWVNLDKVKEAQQRYTEHEAAYKLFLLSDQAVQEANRLKRSISECLVNMLDRYNRIKKYKADIEIGKTEETFQNGTKMDLDDLKVGALNIHNECERYLAVMRTEAAKLYTFVGRKGLDMKPFFKLEEYDGIIKDAVHKLEGTPYKLY